MAEPPRRSLRKKNIVDVVLVCATPLVDKEGERFERDMDLISSGSEWGRTGSALGGGAALGKLKNSFGQVQFERLGSTIGRRASLPGVIPDESRAIFPAPPHGGLAKLKKLTKGFGLLSALSKTARENKIGFDVKVYEEGHGAVNAERQNDAGDGPPPVWNSKLVDGLARKLKKVAQLLTIKVQIPMSRNIVEQAQNFTNACRVAIICLDSTSNLQELALIMRERQAEGSIIIPVLLPGYAPPKAMAGASVEGTEIISWWPKAMPPLQPYCAYVDMRDERLQDQTLCNVSFGLL